MINVCPNCGYALNKGLVNGIAHCSHCNRVISTTPFNEILAASWEARKKDLTPEMIEWQTKLEKDFANFVYYFVCVLGYSHDEFLTLIKKFQLVSPKQVENPVSEKKI
jgi:hypothetical protein